jgi:spore coat protein U-like protein
MTHPYLGRALEPIRSTRILCLTGWLLAGLASVLPLQAQAQNSTTVTVSATVDKVCRVTSGPSSTMNFGAASSLEQRNQVVDLSIAVACNVNDSPRVTVQPSGGQEAFLGGDSSTQAFALNHASDSSNRLQFTLTREPDTGTGRSRTIKLKGTLTTQAASSPADAPLAGDYHRTFTVTVTPP